MNRAKTTGAAPDPMPSHPEASAEDEVHGQLRDLARRFGLRLLDPSDLSEIGGRACGRSLLVGWRRARFDRPVGATADVGADRPASVPRCGSDLPSAELQRRSRRHSGGRISSSIADIAPPADRWAIVSLVGESEALLAAEAAMLGVLAAGLEVRIGDRAVGTAGTGRRDAISRRERECLQWTAAGKTTWEIAGILDISQNTVDGYIASAGRKLGAVNRTQAVAVALRRGLID
ncbi:MAG: helix-turn-helix domain-containing protein [Siculibacillus sp.]|nr:helix-turn-helix domain-containing protein [Siculibacillus sp.]